MTDLENKIWDLVNKWCKMQYHEVPEANKRYLMDMIHSLVKNCNKPHVINCVALPEWLSKERCALAGNIWKSHKQGDNKRVKAVLQIKEWAADAGYSISIKKAHELFEQHCL